MSRQPDRQANGMVTAQSTTTRYAIVHSNYRKDWIPFHTRHPAGFAGAEGGAAAGAGRRHERQDPVGDLGGEGEGRGGAGDARCFEDPVQHVGEVLVGAGDDPQVEIPLAGGGLRLDHLRDGVEVVQDARQLSLGDLDLFGAARAYEKLAKQDPQLQVALNYFGEAAQLLNTGKNSCATRSARIY